MQSVLDELEWTIIKNKRKQCLSWCSLDFPLIEKYLVNSGNMDAIIKVKNPFI